MPDTETRWVLASARDTGDGDLGQKVNRNGSEGSDQRNRNPAYSGTTPIAENPTSQNATTFPEEPVVATLDDGIVTFKPVRDVKGDADSKARLDSPQSALEVTSAGGLSGTRATSAVVQSRSGSSTPSQRGDGHGSKLPAGASMLSSRSGSSHPPESFASLSATSYSEMEETPAAGPSRTVPESPSYRLVPLAGSPVSPARIMLSSGSGQSSFARLKKTDAAPEQVYLAVPTDEDEDIKPSPGEPVNRAFVVLDISRKTRDTLIARGVYDPFRDDWYESDTRKRQSGMTKWLYESGALVRGSKMSARARPPEAVPDRFITRAGPALLEPWASVLTADSLLNRLGEYRCGWKGCSSILNSENNLVKHVRIREHAIQGVFTVGQFNEIVLYRCHWRDCDGPCFDSVQNLMQHIHAVHTSKVLICPYEGCSLRSHNISHLQRHVMKQHDEEGDKPRVRVDRPWRAEPKPLPVLPKTIRVDELVTPAVRPMAARTNARAEWVRHRVQTHCFAPPDPEIHVVHPPPMLQPLASGTATPALSGDNGDSSDGAANVDDAPSSDSTTNGVVKRRRGRPPGKRPQYVAKKSRLSHVVDFQDSEVESESDEVVDGPVLVPEEPVLEMSEEIHEPEMRDEIHEPEMRLLTGPPPVSRVSVEIPLTRPLRRRGERVVFYDFPLPDDEPRPVYYPIFNLNRGARKVSPEEEEGEEEIEEGWAGSEGSNPLNRIVSNSTEHDNFHSAASEVE